MADEMVNSTPDAASVMQQTISEFQGGGESAPAPTQPEPTEPATAPTEQTETPQEQPEGQSPNWYESLLNEGQEQPDELTTLLNEESFNGLRENPAGLNEWSQKAFGHLQKYNEGTERERSLSTGAEHIGGWENAEHAFNLFGDLYRGDIALDETDSAEFPNARNYAERALSRVMQSDPTTAYSLGAAALNLMPELLTANNGYLLRTLGLDPKYAEDYKRVAQAGGFQINEDQQAIQEWFQTNNVPTDQLETLRRLPAAVQRDILAGDIEAGKFHLEEHHDKFQQKDSQAKAAEDQRNQAVQKVEYESARTLAGETRKVFDEYVAKGKTLGLNDLEAAGLAAMAYSEIEQQYWDDGTESRTALDKWHGHIKTGNKLQIEGGRSGYRKAFESAYRKAAGQYSPKRPGIPVGAANQNRANSAIGNQQPQFNPAPPSKGDLNGLTGADLMNEIMRRNGASV